MKNQMYGTISFDVSMDVKSNNEELAVLEANYKISNLIIKEVVLTFVDFNDELHSVNVHNWDVNWERFFGDDE
jgi:hypothetical protein